MRSYTLIFALHKWILLLMKTFLSFLSFSWSVKWEEKKKKPIPFPNLSLTILQNKAPIIWVWVVVVKNKCWWSSDVYNSIQVLLHIKTLYGHIIKERRYCLDWCASWFQVANSVLMYPYNARPSAWQTGELVVVFRRQIVNERLLNHIMCNDIL